ncbi:unnamed protein product [Durusdinium trenchii]|uniref:Protein kinase domain-containing protein n=1 Tax=Durusdinium trenchii TaxID=1381693 RepID=A0ABP0SY62_9DINO
MGLRGWGFGLWLLVWQAPSLRGLDPQRGELPCSLGSKRTDGSKGSEMATFRFIHAESGWPLHIDGLGDKLASLRYGDCRDDFSAFWIEPAGEGRVYLRNLATELPLHINGLGDQLASVRCGDCMDDYSQFYLCTAPFPSQSTPDGLLLLSVAMGRALRIGADRMASTMEEGTDQESIFRLEAHAIGLRTCRLLGPQQMPLHVDGLGDQMASQRFGHLQDEYCKFNLELSPEGGFFLINLGSGLPLRVDSDGQVSVSADARDAFARFALDAATSPGSFYVKSVGAGKAVCIHEKMAILEDDHTPATAFWLPICREVSEAKSKGDIPSGYEMVGTRPLGRGGFGVVHCCRSLLDGRLCAVKTTYQKFEENEAFLRTELVNLAHLPSHPNLLRYYTCFLEKGRLHIVTEFLDAVKLYHLIKGSKASPSPAESVSCWFLQLFKGLSCLHSIGMIHRDLHAENVLISRDERREVSTCPSAVKIIDVGLSKISELLEPSVMSVKGVGPAWYFSPERRAGEAFDHLDDVWAAGCMLAEMIISEGCYIQNCPSHGPGGIDFSSRPQAVEKLLQLCETSSAAVGRVPRKALAKRIHRALAGQMAELLEDVSKSAGGAVMWRGTGRCFWGLKVDRGSLRFWVSSCAFSRWYRPAIPSGQSILFLYSYCTVMYVLSS